MMRTTGYRYCIYVIQHYGSHRSIHKSVQDRGTLHSRSTIGDECPSVVICYDLLYILTEVMYIIGRYYYRGITDLIYGGEQHYIKTVHR